MNMITINGYESNCICEHCGRKLTHGIKMEQDGFIKTVGAACFLNDITRPQTYNGKEYKLSTKEIINKAKWLECKTWEWLVSYRGFSLNQIQFEAK